MQNLKKLTWCKITVLKLYVPAYKAIELTNKWTLS